MYLFLLLLDILLFFVSGYFFNKNKHINKIFRNVVFILLVAFYVLLVAYRPIETTPDYLAYYKYYYRTGVNINDILSTGIFEKNIYYNMEIGLSLLFYLSNSAGISIELFNILLTSFEITIILIYIKKILKRLDFNNNNYFYLMIYIIIFYGLFYQFIALRQGIAITFGIMAIYYTLINKYILTGLLLLFSMLFHNTGIVMLVPIIVLKCSNKHNFITYLYIILIYTIVVMLGLENVFTSVGDFVAELVNEVNTVYSVYSSGYHGVGGPANIRIVFSLLTLLLVIRKNENVNYWKIINIIITGLITVVLLGSWRISQRIYDMLFLFYIFAFCGVEKKVTLYVKDNNNYINKLYPIFLIVVIIMRLVYNLRVLQLL